MANISTDFSTWSATPASNQPDSLDTASIQADLQALQAALKIIFPNIGAALTPTHTELNYVDGVTSAIQTQLDAKAASGANSDITSLSGLTIPYAQSGANSDITSLNGCSLTGLLNVNDGADIASATTVDLTAATGNTVRIIGTTPITAFTMNAGQQMELVAVDALPLTYHATTMNINGGASYTCAANDRLSVFKDGAGVIQVNVTKQDGSAIMSGTLNTEQTATGALMQFTGIPSTAKRITVIFNGVSVSGTSNVKFQLGTTVALETTGYASTVTSGAGGASTSSSTSGHMATGQIISAHAYSGHVVFTKVSGNTWVGSGTLLSSGTLAYSISASTKTLSGALTRIGLLCDNGSDTFDSGTFNAIYE